MGKRVAGEGVVWSGIGWWPYSPRSRLGLPGGPVEWGMASPVPPPEAERIIRWLMIGVAVWGCIHAVGAWRLNHDPRRMLVVLGCVAAFLGFWLVMLSVRRRRLAK